MKKIYVHEDGRPLTAKEIEQLQQMQIQPRQKRNEQPTFVKVWLLVLLTIFVVAGIVFAAIEVVQTQEILDVFLKWLKSK